MPPHLLGHDLIDGGAPFYVLGRKNPNPRARVRQYGDKWFQRVDGDAVNSKGAAVCQCGESSGSLGSVDRRRQWHREHLDEATAAIIDPGGRQGARRQVVGFLFDDTGEFVLLIKKNRPEWMKGRMCGVGGSIEGEESPVEAMVREFLEETGVATNVSAWVAAPMLMTDHATDLSIFGARSSVALDQARAITDEPLCKVPVATLAPGPRHWPGLVIPNIPFLVATAWYCVSYQELHGKITEGDYR